jgi:hypothetical protein
MSARYNLVKEFIVKPAAKVVKKVFKPQKTTGTEVAQPFKYKPPKNKLEKVTRDLQIATQKESGKIKKYIQKMESDIEPFRRKLRQSTQKLDKKPVTESGFNKGADLEKKAKGGRVGLSKGSGFPDYSGDGKITMRDILMGRGVIPKKKGKKKMMAKKTETPMQKAVKKNKKKII